MPVMPDAGTANALYWESDTSVAQIAARFDLSRRALYETIRPLPADAACAFCGGGLVFENRLARRNGHGICTACGERQTTVTDTPPEPGPASASPASYGRSGRDDDRAAWGPATDERTADLRHRAVLLGGAAIAGLAIGTVAALWARRHD